MVGVRHLKLNNGSKMPSFGYGTWQLAEGAETITSVFEALQAGYRLIDTARIYGNERGVGEGIRRSDLPRKEVFVTTKLWPSDFGYDSALQAFDESLDKLGMEYLDLYLIHWPRDDKEKRQESWRALGELYKQGLSKSIGVSNYAVHHLQEVLDTSNVAPAVNQIEFHPYIYEEQKPILEFCKKHGIVVQAYSPLSRGLGLDNITVNDIAQRLNRTPAQVVLRWAIQHGTVPIPKSAHPERIKENFRIFDFVLSADDMNMLDALSRAPSYS